VLPALRQETETAVAGTAQPEAREQPQREGPGPPCRERLSEEEGGESKVGDDVGGGSEGGEGKMGGAEDGRRADDGAQGGLDDPHVPFREVPAGCERTQAAVVERPQ
jgi:hypothetical protein